MKFRVPLFLLVVSAMVLTGANLFAQGQGQAHAPIIIPDSSTEHAGDRGVNAHTNHQIRGDVTRNATPAGENPASIRAVYNLPANVASGGSGTIAIVDAFDYQTAENDLNVFSSQFGLPACTTANGCFSKVNASAGKTRVNCGWGQEAALDIEWAHAMAPNAKIVLVQARTNSFADLFTAVDKATSIVTSGSGKGEVSMSWSGGEFSSESANDGHFQNTNVVYFAASGDTGGVNGYPSVSPYVVSAGGTTINRNGSGVFTGETAWSGSGGGPSQFETKLSYQSGVAGTDPTQRSAPDLSFDADPNSGVAVYDSTSCQGFVGWLVFGGTSVSTPALAGIVNSAATAGSGFAASSVAELTRIYGNFSNATWYRDITSGSAGSFSAGTGYDFVTGVGSSLTLSGK